MGHPHITKEIESSAKEMIKRVNAQLIDNLRDKWDRLEAKIERLKTLRCYPRPDWPEREMAILSQEIDDLTREYASVCLFQYRDRDEWFYPSATDGQIQGTVGSGGDNDIQNT